ncbi:DUF167 domain-containing protein [bacterium]|nr:MAG: DUF167 domain-containing protein [bacterium]
MVINVKVNPKASRNLVKQEKDGLRVYLTKPAYNGLANKQLIEILAEHYRLKKYQVRIIQGESSRNKLIELSAVSKPI